MRHKVKPIRGHVDVAVAGVPVSREKLRDAVGSAGIEAADPQPDRPPGRRQHESIAADLARRRRLSKLRILHARVDAGDRVSVIAFGDHVGIGAVRVAIVGCEVILRLVNLRC